MRPRDRKRKLALKLNHQNADAPEGFTKTNCSDLLDDSEPIAREAVPVEIGVEESECEEPMAPIF
jgi:hypothetical protein